MSSELFETAVSIDAREVRRIAGTASDLSQAVSTATQALEAAATAHVFSDEGDTDACTNRVSSVASYARTTGPDHSQPDPQRGPQKTSNNGEAIVEVLNGDSTQERRKGGSDAERDYTEQLVLFDSLTASLPEVFGPANAPSEMAAVLAAAGVPPSTLETLAEGHHNLYHCIQHSKKFHPDFDPVLRGVLQSDPAAKIVLTAGSKVCLSAQ